MRFYSAGAAFRARRRLTAFGTARNIVRIRMITAVSAGFDMVMETTSAAVDKIRCDACPVMCYIKPGAAGACDRYANHDGKLVRVDPHIILERTVSQGGKLVPFSAHRRLGRQDRPRARDLRDRDRRRHHLSRLQAGAVHRLLGGRRRRHGDRRHRGHLLLLRRQGEDRHRPLSRPGERDRARAGRGGRPRHHQRIRLADAVARRRASSHRRLQEGGPRHLRHADGPRQLQGGGADRSTAARAWWCRPASRRSSTA